MHPLRRQRLILMMLIIFGISIALALALYALQQNINLYYTPSQVAAGETFKGQVFRIGGIVKTGSVNYAKKNLEVSFFITDKTHNVKVEYSGVLPDLFREGQSIVVQGKLNANNILIADQVLAKHGATYMPTKTVAVATVTNKKDMNNDS